MPHKGKKHIGTKKQGIIVVFLIIFERVKHNKHSSL